MYVLVELSEIQFSNFIDAENFSSSSISSKSYREQMNNILRRGSDMLTSF